jgi:hypothetical protein
MKTTLIILTFLSVLLTSCATEEVAPQQLAIKAQTNCIAVIPEVYGATFDTCSHDWIRILIVPKVLPSRVQNYKLMYTQGSIYFDSTNCTINPWSNSNLLLYSYSLDSTYNYATYYPWSKWCIKMNFRITGLKTINPSIIFPQILPGDSINVKVWIRNKLVLNKTGQNVEFQYKRGF